MAKKLVDKPGEIDRETWHQILKAAEELFLAKGYRGVSVKEIADAVHVTPAALYYHFPQGKEDLFLTVIQVMFEQWTTGIGPAVASAHDVRERLQMLTSYLLTLPVDHFPALIQDAKEQIKDCERQQAIFRQLRGTFQQHILEILQQAIDAGEILLIGYGVTFLIKIPFVISATTLLAPFVISASIGVTFGLYPAIRASRLDPIDALRSA